MGSQSFPFSSSSPTFARAARKGTIRSGAPKKRLTCGTKKERLGILSFPLTFFHSRALLGRSLEREETIGKDWKFLRLNHDSRHWRVDRVLANHSLGSTASQGTSNIPFPWFLLSQCNRQARNQERSTIMCLAEEHFSYQQLLNHIFLLSSKRSCEKCSTFTTSWSLPKLYLLRK